MIRAMADNQKNVSCKDDASLYNFLAGGDCIFSGIGNQLACSKNGLVITLGTGGCLIGGRHVYVENRGTQEKVTLPSNATGYIVLRYQTTQPAGNEVSLLATPTLCTENLNNGGTVRDLVLYKYNTALNTINTFEDKRIIKPSPTESVIFELRGKSLYITKRN